PWDDAQIVSEYVATCEGDPVQAVRNGIFGVFQDESVAEVAQWMCAWNQAHPDDPVYFTGFDVQQGWDDGRRLRDFLIRAVPAKADPLYAGLDHCTGVGFPNADAWYASAEAGAVYSGQMDAEQHAGCMTALDEVAALFDTREAELVAATSEEALAWARISLVGLVGWELQLWEDADCTLSYEVRGLCAAENAGVVVPGCAHRGLGPQQPHRRRQPRGVRLRPAPRPGLRVPGLEEHRHLRPRGDRRRIRRRRPVRL
ncbi:MAG: erythromycin esterase family protein, partial [Deltaproteobacteria bacterium]|nr:erythromycin esterase family protein [Deltaproteobacteria bacterium]